jgi:hypothetical protein
MRRFQYRIAECFGLHCGVCFVMRFVGFGVQVGFRFVFLVELVLFDINHGVFSFKMLVEIHFDRSKLRKRRNVIFFGLERGCFALGLGNVLGESGGFLFG